MNRKIRILIGDDHPIVRDGLVHALNQQEDMGVIGEAGNGVEVCRLYQLWDTIRRVVAGDVVLPQAVSGKLAAYLAEPQLSQREMQVLRQLCVGDSNKEIAQKIYLSESTVKFYIRQLYRKLGAVGRSAAIAIAARRGLVRIT